MWEWLWNCEVGFKKSVSESVKCLEHTVHRILDSEEIASKGINGSEENFIWNWKLRRDRFNNTHTYVQGRDLQFLVIVWGVRNVRQELADVAKEISQQNVEGATWFLLPDL